MEKASASASMGVPWRGSCPIRISCPGNKPLICSPAMTRTSWIGRRRGPLRRKSPGWIARRMMRWLIDSDILIEGERGNPAFVRWLESVEEVATAEVVRCEFLMGVHAVADAAKRRRGEQFYAERVASLVSLANDSADYKTAARMAGEARRSGKGSPGVVDGLQIGRAACRE